MDAVFSWLLDNAFAIANDPRALSLFLFALVSLLLFHSTRRTRQELLAGLLECRRDGVEDAGIIVSVLTMLAEYRVVSLLTSKGPKRQPPPELAQLEEKYRLLRTHVHDVRNDRVQRMDKLALRVRATMKEKE